MHLPLVDITPVGRGDLRYPTALAAIDNPPETLWVRGHADQQRQAKEFEIETFAIDSIDSIDHGFP